MNKILIVSGHTDINNSIANRTILDELSNQFENTEIRKLDLLYSDYKIDVKTEQDKLKEANIILLQYPVFWYGMPSIMQKWVEDVFTYGFAYGSTGNYLANKKLIVSMTFGGSEKDYSENSPISKEDVLIVPKGLCSACKMTFSGYECLFDISYNHLDDSARLKILERVKEYTLKIKDLINKAL